MTPGFQPYPHALEDRLKKTGSFRYINQTVMTKAVAPTIDSWVHLAQTRKPPLAATLFFVVAALGLVYLVMYALITRPIWWSHFDVETGKYLFGIIALSAIALGCGFSAYLLIWRTVRNGSFGARPSGVALGENGVIVRVPGRDAEIPWTTIRSITPKIQAISERHRRDLPLIEMKLDPHAPITERLQLITATGYLVPGDALYSALRWYHAHPETRWELGRVEGERRIEGWVQDAVNFATAPIG